MLKVLDAGTAVPSGKRGRRERNKNQEQTDRRDFGQPEKTLGFHVLLHRGRNFLFDLENDNIVPPISPVATIEDVPERFDETLGKTEG